MQVPKKLHCMWVQGWQCRPTWTTKVSSTWKTITTNGWNLYCWDKQSVQRLVNDLGDRYIKDKTNDLMHSFTMTIQRADILRLIVLYVLGGVYMDLDFVVIRDIEHLIGDSTFVIGREHDHYIANGFIASTARHRVLRLLLDHIHTQGLKNETAFIESDNSLTKRVLETTGPHNLTKLLWFLHFFYRKQLGLKLLMNSLHLYSNKVLTYDLDNMSCEDIQRSVKDARVNKEIFLVHYYAGSWK